MNLLKGILTIFGTALLVVSCCTVILLHWSAFGWKVESVPTGSMRPNMPPGSLALMHQVPDSTLKVGDIITYDNPLNPKSTISHRIIEKYKADNNLLMFITKGDANKSADIPVVEGLVQGKVVRHINNVGWLLIWSKTLIGIAFLIWLPSLLIIIDEMLRLSDYFKLSQPYKLIGYKSYGLIENVHKWTPKLALGISSFILCLFAIGYTGPQVYALLKSNTVMLTYNRLAIKGKPTTKNQCGGSTTNNISVNNNSSQSSSSGNTTVSGNTNGGSASSGSSKNSNTTTTSITISNC